METRREHSNIKPRGHGFERPLNWLQILSWFLFAFHITIFYALYIPILDRSLKIIFGSLFSFFSFFSVISFVLSTLIVPTDKNVVVERKIRSKGIPFTTPLKQFCTICLTHVNSKTKHCGQCNRCCYNFDHHCKWLNNCVGGYNYRYFLVLIAVLWMEILTKLILEILFILENLIEERVFNLDDDLVHSAETLAFVVFSLIQEIFLIGMLSDLIIFHVYLRFKRMTTYEYILIQRAKLQAKSKKFMPSASTTKASKSSKSIVPISVGKNPNYHITAESPPRNYRPSSGPPSFDFIDTPPQGGSQQFSMNFVDQTSGKEVKI